MHYPSPFHFVHSTSLQVAATYEQHTLTLTHTHTHTHMQARSTTIPLALIFQQRHSIRQRPCHRLLPRDTDPRSARLVLTLQHHHQDGESTQLTSKLSYAVPNIPRSPLLPIPHPPVTPAITTTAAAATAISREEQEEGKGREKEGWKEGENGRMFE